MKSGFDGLRITGMVHCDVGEGADVGTDGAGEGGLGAAMAARGSGRQLASSCRIRQEAGPEVAPRDGTVRLSTALLIAIAHLTRHRSYPYEGGGLERLG